MADFETLLKNDTPLIDVRAPIEFNEGHFPTSINLPIMNDEERKAVGTAYKQEGQNAAITLGHSLVSGKIKEDRINAWAQFIHKNPSAKLYCFRGGLRSQISVEWLKDAGIEVERIPGGYKELRRFLLEQTEKRIHEKNLYILSGRTGVGKTQFLKMSNLPALDLEEAAHHKGSSFGALGPQPAQITFENRIAVRLLKIENPTLFVEDESVMIGACVTPRSLRAKMLEAPIIVLEKTIEERISHIFQEYVIEKTFAFNGEFEITRTFMVASLNRILKKLGGLRHSQILREIQTAFTSDSPSIESTHEPWIRSLLEYYYDPLYDRALKRNEKRIIFRGNRTECAGYVKQLALP